jgi:ribosomal protein S18 acetylase RimI-like enzyme
METEFHLEKLTLQRVLKASDLKFCAELMLQSEPWKTYCFTFKQCVGVLQGDKKEVYVALYEEQKVGFVAFHFEGLLRGYIQTLCIKSSFTSKGIGTFLLEFCEGKILKKFPNVFLCVSSFNLQAQKLYYRLGYKKIGELKNHIAQGYDEIILQKHTCPINEYKIIT